MRTGVEIKDSIRSGGITLAVQRYRVREPRNRTERIAERHFARSKALPGRSGNVCPQVHETAEGSTSEGHKTPILIRGQHRDSRRARLRVNKK